MFVKILKSLIVLLFVQFVIACSSGSSDKSSNEPTPQPSDFADPTKLATTRNNAFGNFTIVNPANSELIISTDSKFRPTARLYKFSSPTLRIDTRSMGGSDDLIRLYAISADELKTAHDNNTLPEDAVSTSQTYIAQDGGSWNPYGMLSSGDNIKSGTLVVCNHYDQIIGVSINSPSATIEGVVNRGECQVSIKLPANGLMEIYFVDMETLAEVEQHQLGIIENTRTSITLGERDTPLAKATLLIHNNHFLHYDVSNSLTQQLLYNESCNECSTIIAGSTGKFEVPANISLELILNSTSGNITLPLDPIAFAQETTTAFVIEKNENDELVISPFNIDECYWSYYEGLCDNNDPNNFSWEY